MTTTTFAGMAAGLFLATGLFAAPAHAADQAAPAAQPTPLADAACPEMTPTPALSPEAQGLFAVIANACKLRNAGLIEDYQFQMIRDQAVNELMAAMQADADARQAKSLAVVP